MRHAARKENTYAQAFENQVCLAGMKTLQKSFIKIMRCKKGGVPSKLARTWETICLSNWEILYGVTFSGKLTRSGGQTQQIFRTIIFFKIMGGGLLPDNSSCLSLHPLSIPGELEYENNFCFG